MVRCRCYEYRYLVFIAAIVLTSVSVNFMNWFALASVPLYFGASVTALVNGNAPMAGVWFFYATANLCLVYAEWKAVR